MEQEIDTKSRIVSTRRSHEISKEDARGQSDASTCGNIKTPVFKTVLNELISGGIRPFMTDWSGCKMPVRSVDRGTDTLYRAKNTDDSPSTMKKNRGFEVAEECD